jgi:DNA primase catalytic core
LEVTTNFGQSKRTNIDTKFGDGTIIINNNDYQRSYNSTKVQESIEIKHRKERILLANAYAAIYYTNCFKESYAGGARYYLRNIRQLSLPLFRTMMIGYAPDTYYDHRFIHNNKVDGPISLVRHLLQSGFTVEEVLDSGLAVVRKNQTPSSLSSAAILNSTDSNEVTLLTKSDPIDPSSLMDRFRDRIMVPILDESGANILGFGGRIIPPPPESLDDMRMSEKQQNYKAAKYLNSPESLVFEKRKILFNQHLAQKSIHNNDRTASTLPLLMVEGYMDVISLWEVGIRNVAASMGTAISPEQLDLASITAGTRGGKIVICLDNDDAGNNAIERLCRNGMIEECIRKNVVSIRVARLPKQIKDPADFIE